MKILILNQYFPPDQAATAQLLGPLASFLAGRHEVHVICGTPTYAPDSEKMDDASLTLHRVFLIALSRHRLVVRLLNYLLFLLGATLRALTLPKFDLVMAWTDPPVIGLLGVLLKRVHGSRFVFVSQDVYPEIALAAGRMNNPLSVGLLRFTSRTILGAADHVVAVGRDMKERLLQKRVLGHRVSVIPNWQDLTHLQPGSGDEFRKRHGISSETFVVMHSGNIGISQDFETLLQVAELTQKEPHLQYLFVGSGGRRAWLEQEILRRRLTQVRVLPYQPSSFLAQSLGAADLHYVSLLPSFDGYIVPSKIYGILAVGRPVLANVSEHTEVAQIVRNSGCGFLCPPQAETMAQTIRGAMRDRDQILAMGARGRRWVEEYGGKENAFQAYARVLEGWQTP